MVRAKARDGARRLTFSVAAAESRSRGCWAGLGPVHANTPNYVVSIPIVQKKCVCTVNVGGFRHIFTHREELTVIYSDSSYLPSPPILSVSVNRP